MPPKIKTENEFAIKENRSATTEEQAKKYDTLIDKAFVQVDLETGKPLAEAKEFIWRITHTFPATLGHNSGHRLQFQIQKYYRNQYYEAESRTEIAQDGQRIKRNRPYVVVYETGDRKNEIKELGERCMDCEDFTKEFRIDATAGVAEEFMQSVTSLE